MVVTPEVIGVVIAAIGAATTLLAGVAALISRLERRLDRRFDRIETDIAGVKAELVEVKIAIARIEGPQTRLLRP